jgi:uncharacterized protein YcsI (UPF0317 family)
MAVAGAGLTRVTKIGKETTEGPQQRMGIWMAVQCNGRVRLWRFDLLRQCKRDKRACPVAQAVALAGHGLAGSQ